MRLIRSLALVGLTCVVPLLAGGGLLVAQDDAGRDRRIAVWGSSVGWGTADELEREGYTGRLRELLADRGWDVRNQSRPGDSTVSIAERFVPEGTPDPDTRYLTTVDPGYAVIALSLGNEGVKSCDGNAGSGCAATKLDADRVYQQFSDNMAGWIRRIRAEGITPVVALMYTRADFGSREYAYTRQMNLAINRWDVPSINVLGAVDNGQGQWAHGFWSDALHPNAAGYQEMFHAVVPSLFDALAADKPTPTRPRGQGFARVRGNDRAPMTFEPDDTMRSFGVSFFVRSQGDGTVASVGGQTVDHTVEWKSRRRRNGMLEYEAATLTPSGRRFQATLGLFNGRWVYVSANGTSLTSSSLGADGQWHHVALSHYVARGQTLVYIDGRLVGTIDERLQPDRFVLGGPGPDWSTAVSAEADYRGWMVHRAGLNADEVEALASDSILQASLEIYAPLNDGAGGGAVENRAQSLSTITVHDRSVSLTEDQ